MKIYVAGPEHYGKWIKNYELVRRIDKADLVILTGGADVNPLLYGQKKLILTSTNDVDDSKDTAVTNIAIKEGVPILGICRGSQFLCVRAGGTLIQDCDNHAISGTHKIITKDGDIFEITSTHHQMANLDSLKENEDYQLIAKAHPKLSTYYKDDTGNLNIENEPEITYYPKINALGIQGHPEYMGKDEPIVNYLNYLINYYLIKEKVI